MRLPRWLRRVLVFFRVVSRHTAGTGDDEISDAIDEVVDEVDKTEKEGD